MNSDSLALIYCHFSGHFLDYYIFKGKIGTGKKNVAPLSLMGFEKKSSHSDLELLALRKVAHSSIRFTGPPAPSLETHHCW